MNAKSAASSYFQKVIDGGDKATGAHSSAEDAIIQGELVKEIRVTVRMRALWRPLSRRCDWATVSWLVDGEEKFSFALSPELDTHVIQTISGRILVYEDRKREVVGQLNYQWDVNRLKLDQVGFWALELGASTMLILEKRGEDIWRRVGVARNVRNDYFALAGSKTLYL